MGDVGSSKHAQLVQVAQSFADERFKLERKVRFTRIVLWSLCVASSALLIGMFASSSEENAIKLVWVPMALAGCAVGIRKYLFEGFLQRYKHEVVPQLLSQFGVFEYAASGRQFDVGRMITSGLLPSYDRLSSEDMIWGKYRDWPVDIVNVSAWVKRNKTTDQVFSGILLRTKMRREVDGVYGLFPGLVNGSVRGNLQDIANWERIRLESDAFEDLYDFYGTDQVLGRTLLTPAVIEKWTSLAQNPFTNDVTAIMRYGYLHLAIQTDKDWIDAQILAYSRDEVEKQLAGIQADLQAVFEAVDLLVFDNPQG